MKKAITYLLVVAGMFGIAGISKKAQASSARPTSYKHINNMDEFKSSVFNRRDGRVKVVKFHAVWCGACKKMAPIFESVSNQHKDKADFFKVDIDKARDVAQSEGVQGIPTFKYYRNGQEIQKFAGVIDRMKLAGPLMGYEK